MNKTFILENNEKIMYFTFIDIIWTQNPPNINKFVASLQIRQNNNDVNFFLYFSIIICTSFVKKLLKLDFLCCKKFAVK